MNREAKIFKNLKQKYNYLIEKGYEVVYVSLQGSQNYGLDLYTDDYVSDIDCFAVVLPSFDDFVNLNHQISTTLVLDNNEHINIKDIRSMFELYSKQNIQYLETLFTDYKIINKKYKNYANRLFEMKYDIANISRDLLIRSIFGMSSEKYHALHHPYPSIIDKINKYGYDGKQLSHLIRLYYFLRALENDCNFKQSLTAFNDIERQLLLDTKCNKFSLEEADKLADMYFNIMQEKHIYYKEHIWKDKKYSINETTINKLNKLKNDILKSYFKEQLVPVEQQPYKLCPDHYRNVFITSDTHFGHNNIIKYEHRDTKLNINTIEEHDNKLIENWNRVVKSGDLVLILGDFSFHKAVKTSEILTQLNGDKVLIEGNHDCIYLEDKNFDKSLFKAIYDYKETTYKGVKLVLMHYMLQTFKHKDKDINPYVQLFGHIHSVPYTVPRHSYNVGADINNYTPIRLELAIKKALSQNDEYTNGTI